MTMRRINVVILVLLVVAFLIILQRNLLNLNDFLRHEGPETAPGALLPFEPDFDAKLKPDVIRTGVEIPVVITAAEERLGAAVAAMNSVYRNSKSNIVFNIVTLNDSVDHLRAWMNKADLKGIKHKIITFEPNILEGKISDDSKTKDVVKPVRSLKESTGVNSNIALLKELAKCASYRVEQNNLVQHRPNVNAEANRHFKLNQWDLTVGNRKYYMPMFLPGVEKAIYLDDDVIVQGDIQELFDTNLKAGHAAAFSDDCDSASSKGIVRGAGNQNNYIGFLDFKKEAIRKLSMRASTCSFNPGVIVANLTEWKIQNITSQLEQWMERNVKEDLYSKTLADSVTTPPLLIVFYKRHSSIDPLWHVRHLGATGAANRYSAQFLNAAKLLHWNGHYKPWGRLSSFSDVWDKWYIPDPLDKFHPIRRHSDDKLTD